MGQQVVRRMSGRQLLVQQQLLRVQHKSGPQRLVLGRRVGLRHCMMRRHVGHKRLVRLMERQSVQRMSGQLLVQPMEQQRGQRQ